jgi:DNA-binding CsgD family transcriptional regulator
MSESIPVHRVRALLRLVGEVREISASGEDPASHVAHALPRLAGADAGGVVFGPNLTGTGENLTRLLISGFSETDRVAAERFYASGNGTVHDLAAGATNRMLSATTLVVERRRRLVDDDSWYRSDFVDGHRRGWGLDDSIYGGFVTASGSFTGLGCFRAWGSRPFDDIDLAVTRLFWEESAAELVAVRAPLSPRQRETLRMLLAGQAPKEIACALDLSPNTVHDYVRAVYRAFGVHSRAELMAAHRRKERVR